MKGYRTERELELYFHIPFCVRKCLYCDFLSAPAEGAVRERYLEALLCEIKGRAPEYAGFTVTSAFVGGGTPTVLRADRLAELLSAVKGSFCLSPDCEITVECNPGTVTEEDLGILRGAGFNRLSIGLQSALDEELLRIGRIHTWADFLEAYGGARRAGFANVNVDVMSALPGQSPTDYRRTLERVLALTPAPEHISAYSLILEEGTAFWELYERGMLLYDEEGPGRADADEKSGVLLLPGEEADRAMYEETERILGQAGYRRYEISNYAREGFACRHNCGYWQRKNYVGFGIGAASLVDNVRFRNGRSLERYLEDPLGVREETEILSRREQMEEFLFLGLRMTEGVSGEEFRELFGIPVESVYGEVLEKNRRDGLLAIREDAGGHPLRIALTKRGLDVSNYVMSQFLSEEA